MPARMMAPVNSAASTAPLMARNWGTRSVSNAAPPALPRAAFHRLHPKTPAAPAVTAQRIVATITASRAPCH